MGVNREPPVLHNIAIGYRLRQATFHPATVLAAGLVATLSLAGAVAALRPDLTGVDRLLFLAYLLPLGVPFVAYLFDRAERWRGIGWRQWAIEVPVIALALLRAAVPVPLVSGHALFLTYAWLSSVSAVARWSALVVLLGVAAVKIAVWHDGTLIGGLLLGWLAARAVRGVSRPVET